MEFFTLSLLIAIGGLILYYVLRWMTYFERLGLKYDTPIPILGNMAPCLFRKTHIADHLLYFYKKYAGYKYFGFYDCHSPVIIVRDPELINTIAVKNFDYFVDHRGFIDERMDPLMGRNLFSLKGDKWREMRKILSPAFTSSKMKMMHGLMCECAEKFVSHLYRDSKGGRIIDMKDIVYRYTNDVVASCAFGISVDSMENPTNQFYVLGRKAMTFDTILTLKFLISRNFHHILKLFRIRMFSEEVCSFFTNVVKDTVKMREEKGIYRPDMIQLMMESKGKNTTGDLTIEEMTAQAFVFFFAGFDTTAAILSLMSYELAINPDVQDRLREEIEDTLRESDGRPSYDAVNQMKYMDAVVTETLRKHALATFLDRVCVKEFVLPPPTPGGKSVTIKPGDAVWFNPYSLQRDPQYYPEPEKFMPERFLDNPPDSSTYLPFGLGPRFCIGNRFAIMETKILFFYLLSHCKLEPCSKTPIPMVNDPKLLQLSPKGGFILSIKSLDQSWLNLKNGSIGKTEVNGVAK